MDAERGRQLRLWDVDADRVRSNAEVTRGYAELSRGLSAMIDPGQATWFAFASWASASVGGHLVAGALPELPETLLLRLRFRIRRRGGAQHWLALGNAAVYAELAPVARRFLTLFADDRAYDEPAVKRFLATLEPGPSVPDRLTRGDDCRPVVRHGGQGLLKDALHTYYRARFEQHPRRRAELVLLANAQLGIHEQTRLQTYIAGALCLPPAARAPYGAADGAPGGTCGGRAADTLTEAVFRRLVTRHLLALELPGGSARLGRDLRAPAHGPLFPAELARLRHPQLRTLFGGTFAPRGRVPWASVRSHGRVALGTGARDWSLFTHRMRWILPLFRSRQLDPGIHQVETLTGAGRPVPAAPRTAVTLTRAGAKR